MPHQNLRLAGISHREMRVGGDRRIIGLGRGGIKVSAKSVARTYASRAAVDLVDKSRP
jgi:hypothetical protein